MRILLTLALVSGCSFALQSRPATGRNECTSSRVPAIVDTVITAGAVAAVVYGGIVRNGTDAGNVTAGIGAVGGVVYLGSAVEGYRWSGACREMQSTTTPIAIR
jgi:hypothetical protein